MKEMKFKQFIGNYLTAEDHLRLMAYTISRSDRKDTISPYLSYLLKEYILEDAELSTMPMSLLYWNFTIIKASSTFLSENESFSLKQLVNMTFKISSDLVLEKAIKSGSIVNISQIVEQLDNYSVAKIKRHKEKYKGEKLLRKKSVAPDLTILKEMLENFSDSENGVIADFIISGFNILVENDIRTDILDWFPIPIAKSKLTSEIQISLLDDVIKCFPINRVFINPYSLVWVWRKISTHFDKRNYCNNLFKIPFKEVTSIFNQLARENPRILKKGAFGFTKTKSSFANINQTGEDEWKK